MRFAATLRIACRRNASSRRSPKQLFPPTIIKLLLLCLSIIAVIHVAEAQSDKQSADGSQAAMKAASPSTISEQNRQRISVRAARALSLARDWALRFGREIHQGTQEATCHRAVRSQFDPAKSDPARRGPYRASVVSIDWTRQHADIVKTVSTTMSWHESAVSAIVGASESLAANHTYDENLPNVDYVDVHRLLDIDEGIFEEGTEMGVDLPPDPSSEPNPNPAAPETSSIDTVVQPEQDQSPSAISDRAEEARLKRRARSTEQTVTPQPLVMQPAGTPMPQDEAQGEWQTPLKYVKLSRHPNFGELLVNTEISAVHVPVHIYAGSPNVKNSIAWSEELTRVFKNNLVQNPRLTNQYFASPHGFMRLFPAQKWPIARTDPDLYDARMRPWYVAGASSRKDVIILVDASGSMTGSRRDIAKGVVFEILDTLTHDDHFLVLRFNDFVQQVGVPACQAMRTERKRPKIPLKNTIFRPSNLLPTSTRNGPRQSADNSTSGVNSLNGTDIDSLYLLPATGRNVRHVKTNFTIPTSGIANFSHALVTAFEVLQKYQDSETLGSQCNQAIMLITDGSPSDFEDIFGRYNYPNAPVRVFTYLIGRETGDGTHTKMMACHNRGFYTHVINLAEVRETVQQYISVMARPLVLNRTHPTTWTPAYGELTYQMLTDWIWESRRRERARNMLAGQGIRAASEVGPASARSGGATIRVTSEDGLASDGSTGSEDAYDGGIFSGTSSLDAELEALDIFGYESNPDCFWELHRNDLTTTVVQPVYDQRNETEVMEKYLNKKTLTKRPSRMRTANLLGVAAADMKINDILGLAPSHKLGPNGYPIMLTNNGLAMHHPDLRSILEPLTNDPSEKNSRILKPFFSSLDLVELEHILKEITNDTTAEAVASAMANFLALRNEAVDGKTGWRELTTKRTLDCQRRVQTRRQSFYYKPLDQFPFVFILAIPQPYGSYKLEAQVEVKSPSLPEKLTTYFTTSDYDLWSIHPDYRYCEGPSNNTVTTLLDTLQRIEDGKLNDIEWHPAESSKPPILLPGKIYCDKELVQSLVYDAVATFSFSGDCGPPSGREDEPSLMSMFGVRFSFVATRSGLTRVRHHNADDPMVKKEALAFNKRHARAVDETYYRRTVDYNMLVNDSATLLQVPFNLHSKILDRLAKYELEANVDGPSSLQQPDGMDEPGAPVASALRAAPNDESSSIDGSQDQTGGLPAGTKLSIRDMDLYEKLEILTNSSLHVIATESLIVNEGAQRAVAGVAGVFYDYATFVMRFLNTTNAKFSGANEDTFKRPAQCFISGQEDQEICNEESSRPIIKCGHTNDTLDCLLVDNNGFILVSERLEFVGRHLHAYDQAIMQRLVANGVFRAVNITDHQSICVKQEEKQGAPSASSSSSASPALVKLAHFFGPSSRPALTNLMNAAWHMLASTLAISGFLAEFGQALVQRPQGAYSSPLLLESQQQQSFQAMSALLPKKSYLRPCDRILTRYETRPGATGLAASSSKPEFYSTKCNCPGWFVYEQVPMTNLIMLVVDSAPVACDNSRCPPSPSDPQEDDSLMTQSNIVGQNEAQVCAMFERDSKLHRQKLESCISHHQDEEQIKLCGSASRPTVLALSPLNSFLWSFSLFLLSILVFNPRT